MFLRQKKMEGMDVDGKLLAWADASALANSRVQTKQGFIEHPYFAIGLAVLAGVCGYMFRGV
jgi:hypothetical protein